MNIPYILCIPTIIIWRAQNDNAIIISIQVYYRWIYYIWRAPISSHNVHLYNLWKINLKYEHCTARVHTITWSLYVFECFDLLRCWTVILGTAADSMGVGRNAPRHRVTLYARRQIKTAYYSNFRVIYPITTIDLLLQTPIRRLNIHEIIALQCTPQVHNAYLLYFYNVQAGSIPT